MTVVDEIKARVDIVEIISQTVKLRRSGKSYSGFCPFHSNTRTPAFAVFPESGTWRCFGCNEGGDVFTFLMKKEGWDFATALKYLAQITGVALEPPTPEKKAEEEHLERLHRVLEEAVTFFHHQLLQTRAGEEAHQYLKRRGVLPATIETFGLGYSPPAWDAALKYFLEKEYTEEELLRAGLVSERQENRGLFDRFRNRLMFPIRDAMGKMVGFGARALAADDVPKYLNSPQTELFDKSGLLYGLDLARKAIRQKDQVVIVEGYLDVILPFQAGFNNLVSLMGTALNENQFRTLKRYTRRLILALDADSAGEKATLRGLELARQAMDHSPDFVPDATGLFDARGLIRQEARLQADLRVTTLPAGMDPDEIVLRDPLEWERIVAEARPVVLHVMETLAANRDLEDPRTKSEIASRVLPLIDDVPNAVERESYRQRLARLLRVDERALMRSSVPKTLTVRRVPNRQQSVKHTPALVQQAGVLAFNLEAHCIEILMNYPETLHPLDRFLQKMGMKRLDALEFQKSEFQQLARLVQQSLLQDELEPRTYIRQNAAQELQEILAGFGEPVENGDSTLQRLMEDLARSILRLRLVRVNEGLEQLRNFQQDLQEQGDSDLPSYHEMVVEYSRVREKIDHALSQPVQLD